MREGYLISSTRVFGAASGGVTEGALRATGVTPPTGGAEEPITMSPPDPEVPEKKPRRKFTAKYKLQILQEADACTQPGQLGAFLRSKGLYSSNLTTWRRQRDEGLLDALSPKKRGRKEKEKNPLAPRVAELQRETKRLTRKLKRAEAIIEFQKKISEILGIPQGEPPEEEEGENS
jgi:transposase-like protein